MAHLMGKTVTSCLIQFGSQKMEKTPGPFGDKHRSLKFVEGKTQDPCSLSGQQWPKTLGLPCFFLRGQPFHSNYALVGIPNKNGKLSENSFDAGKLLPGYRCGEVLKDGRPRPIHRL